MAFQACYNSNMDIDYTCSEIGCLESRPLIIQRMKGGTVGSYFRALCSFHWSQKTKKAMGAKEIGERYLNKDGYMMLVTEKGVKSEHRLIMESKLGRLLARGESVHHINGVRNDNRPENLELWLGGIRYGQRAADIVCPHCKRRYNEA